MQEKPTPKRLTLLTFLAAYAYLIKNEDLLPIYHT